MNHHLRRGLAATLLAGTALLACGFLAACAPAKPPGDGEVIDTAPKDLGAAQVLRGQ